MGQTQVSSLPSLFTHPLSLPPHSKCYHSYVQLEMEGEKGGDRAAMETVWSILEEVAQLLDTRAEVRERETHPQLRCPLSL